MTKFNFRLLLITHIKLYLYTGAYTVMFQSKKQIQGIVVVKVTIFNNNHCAEASLLLLCLGPTPDIKKSQDFQKMNTIRLIKSSKIKKNGNLIINTNREGSGVTKSGDNGVRVALWYPHF